MEPPRTPGGSAAGVQDIFSVFEFGFDDDVEDDDEVDENEVASHEWRFESPVLPDLLPSPDLPALPPLQPWPQSASPTNALISPRVTEGPFDNVDPRDMLIYRLNNLISRIDIDSPVNHENLEALHAMVDNMEGALSGNSRPSTRDGSTQTDRDFGALGRRKSAWADEPTSTAHGFAKQKMKQHHLAAELRNQRIAKEAEELSQTMEAVTRSLKERQEESQHIQNILVARLEQAASKIVKLETRVVELESERDEAEMDILNLQIHLKSIEVQMPKDVDAELRDSISTWKAEWSALRRKRAFRQSGSHAQDSNIQSSPARTPRRAMKSPG